MITYVNTVLVSNFVGTTENPVILTAQPAMAANSTVASVDAGKFIFMNCDPNAANLYAITGANTIKIGLVTSKNTIRINPSTKAIEYVPIIKWSNEIKKDNIKHYSNVIAHSTHVDVPETVSVDFTSLDPSILGKFNDGGKRLIVRITYKDLPTRFRKWTESYEYVTKIGDTVGKIGDNIAAMINKEYKRARVVATSNGTGKVTLVAMEYDDNNNADTINLDAVVRFNVNVYYTDPSAAAFASRNKYFPTGVVIDKTPGVRNPLNSKLVRDREILSVGYEGILNHGQGTWPIIKPDVQTNLSNTYDGITLEFENMYHAADDINRNTKQTVEIYGISGQLTTLNTALAAFVA